jgi:MSHA biogenesis protein MshJ
VAVDMRHIFSTLKSSPVSAAWLRADAKFVGLSLREKVLITSTLLLIITAFFHFFVQLPLSTKQAQLEKSVELERTRIVTLKEQIPTIRSRFQVDPDTAVRISIDAAQSKLAVLQEKILLHSRSLINSAAMSQILAHLLGKIPRVNLVDFQVLPRVVEQRSGQSVLASVSTGAEPGVQGSASLLSDAGSSRLIYRHSIDLGLRGAYFDLLAYLREAEQIPQRIYWDRFELVAGDYPEATLRLRFYTFSLDPDWMRL